MHPDRAVHAVVDHHDDDRQAVLNRGGEFLPVHEEVAVAGEADDRPPGVTRLAAIAAGTPKPIEPDAGPSAG